MPLSEYEQRVLDQLEAQLASEDPKLSDRMAAPASPRRIRVALGVGGVLIGLVALVAGLAVSQVWISFAGFLLMFAGAYVALTKPKPLPGGAAQAATSQGKTPQGPNPKGQSRKPGLSDRFLKRFDDRDGI
ncbi:MAG: DUF3040 domain-containing protein [Bifidobacteriaceae bacterium]|jgi:hypothetical protein|nr:DUF3040 domain-containing protein [Bifidobacteriaceae bacterium]